MRAPVYISVKKGVIALPNGSSTLSRRGAPTSTGCCSMLSVTHQHYASVWRCLW